MSAPSRGSRGERSTFEPANRLAVCGICGAPYELHETAEAWCP